MGKATISEYTEIGTDRSGLIVQAVVQPAVAVTHKAFAAPTLHQFNAKTKRFRIYVDAAAEILVGGSTVNAKTSSGEGMAAGQTEYFDLAEPGLYISIYDGTS